MIDAATTLLHRTLLMTPYSTGIRRAELTRLKVGDIDSDRMVIHIRQGKGSKDRDVPLSPKLLETLREYWRWKKPREYLFPGEAKQGSKGEHLTSKAVYHACKGVARRAGIEKCVGPEAYLRVGEPAPGRGPGLRVEAARAREPGHHVGDLYAFHAAQEAAGGECPGSGRAGKTRTQPAPGP